MFTVSTAFWKISGFVYNVTSKWIVGTLSVLHCLFAFLLQNNKLIQSVIPGEQMYNIRNLKKLTLNSFCCIHTHPIYSKFKLKDVCLQMFAKCVVLMIERESSSPKRFPSVLSVDGNCEGKTRLGLLTADPALCRNKHSRTCWGHIQPEFSSLVFGTQLAAKWRGSGTEIRGDLYP